MKPAYRRLLIKLSGGQLAGESGLGISPAVIGRIAISWVLTLPAAGVLSIFFFYFFKGLLEP